MTKKMTIVIIMLFGLSIIGSSIATSLQERGSKKISPVSIFFDTFQPLPNHECYKSSCFYIEYPRSSIPIFIEKSGTFTIQFHCCHFDNLHVKISTAFEPVIDEYWLDITKIYFDGSVWNAEVSTPPEIPVELYNLTVIIESYGAFTAIEEPRAVNIIDEYKESFSFIHITDLHVGDPRGFFYNVYETLQYRSILKCVEEINLLHPDFVLISGDVVFGQLYPFEYSREYKKCYEILQRFDVPTFLCPGNHDGYRRFREDGLVLWQRYFGSHYYSFEYGDYHVLAVNSYDWPVLNRLSFLFVVFNWGGYISDTQLEWIEHDLATSEAEQQIMFLHHNPLWETMGDSLLHRPYANREQLCSLIDEYQIDIVCAGHVHFDNVTVHNNTTYLTTTTPESEIRVEDGYWGYRLIQIENGSLASYNYKEPKYSIPSYHLNISTITPYMIEIENDLEGNYTILVKFTVPHGNYTVNQGSITQSRSDEVKTELYVQVFVEEKSTLSLLLSKV